MFEVGKMYKSGNGNIVKITNIDSDSNYPLRCTVIDRKNYCPPEDNPGYKLNGQYFDTKSCDYDLLSEEIIDVAKSNEEILIHLGNTNTKQPEMQQVYNETLNAIKKGCKTKIKKTKKFDVTYFELQKLINVLDKIKSPTELKAVLAYLNTYYGEQNGR